MRRCIEVSFPWLVVTLFGCGDDLRQPSIQEEVPTLLGRAILPAATFSEGPTSGTRIGQGPIHGQDVPFVDKQPVQGFSALNHAGDGTLWAMPDNGFGSLENSADINLRVYQVKPNFRTASGGEGNVEVLGFVELSDPDNQVRFTITNHFTTERVLTGADFDIESMRIAPDGTFWFGDEFGPFLLHTDAQGKVLEPPFQLPDFENPGKYIRAPQNPFHEEASAVRVMNAARRHAELYGNVKAPVFSPYHVMLAYPGSNPSLHAQRGTNDQYGLTEAAGDVFDIASIQAAGYPIVTWTVNDKPRMLELLALGVDGIISDRSDILLEAVQEFDANGDGTPGDYLTADGLIDGSKFDAQGHRGSRNLRPENTLPAMEAGLDNLMVTLETDTGISQDGVPVLSHDPNIQALTCRRADGAPYGVADQVLIKDLTAAEIQARFICDNVFRGDPQSNDRALSPVSVQFAADQGLMDPYVMPTLDQLFDFVDAYIDYYQSGAGMAHPDAERRWKNAMSVRFNIETKLNPRSDTDSNGDVYKDRTILPEPFAQAVAGVIVDRGLEDRADIQSFDFRTLIYVQANWPSIRTVYLFGDFPIFDGPGASDGTNLQDENGQNTPWLAGMYWPYRMTRQANPFRIPRSGGFEGMALSWDGKKLLPLLEKPLDGTGSELLIHEFDLETKMFTGVRYSYWLEVPGDAPYPLLHITSDFMMLDARHGLILERDEIQGDVTAFKRLYRIKLNDEGTRVTKTLLVDLMNIADPEGVATGEPGDVGIGGGTFAFPFVTIESVAVTGERTVVLVNDNNYPFSVGRHVGTDVSDDSEFIEVELTEPVIPLP